MQGGCGPHTCRGICLGWKAGPTSMTGETGENEDEEEDKCGNV